MAKLIFGNFSLNRPDFNQNFQIFFEKYLKLNSHGVPFSYILALSAWK